ncbi:MAG TPA: 16S rRNA (uracil(1498)-N(3))-methyltransferase [Mycobacteriales bacterium]|nr:16S rRNA (uracil(1498)-N(3))-methyltransferase [Mycobacteriales bacterium]
MTAALFLAETAALAGDRVVLDGAEGRHAADVRRVAVGERIDVTDGAGLLVHGTVTEVRRGAVAVVVDAREHVDPPAPAFVVVQALAKGGRDTDAVEAMTEVGVDVVVAWTAARCVAKWSDRVGARWSAAAREAAKQSHRAWVPQVRGPASTREVCDLLASASLAVVLHESATEPLAGVAVPAQGDVVVVVGPEGGIDPAELASFTDAGGSPRRLGDTVLRTSTAGVAALSVLSAATRWRSPGDAVQRH